MKQIVFVRKQRVPIWDTIFLIAYNSDCDGTEHCEDIGAGPEHTKDNARAAGCLEPTALTGRFEGRGPEPGSPAGHHADEQSSELPQTITVNTDNITVGKIMLAYGSSIKCFIIKPYTPVTWNRSC